MELNNILNKILIKLGILLSIDLVWSTLEKLLDGEVQSSWADLIVGFILMEFIYRELERRSD